MSSEQELTTTGHDLPEGIRSILAHTGKSRSFLREEPIRNTTLDGVPGFELSINLTSYRALPLSCIEGLILKVGGTDIDTSTVSLILNGNSYKFEQLAGLSKVWWFILEPALLFVPSRQPLAPGTTQVEATLITVEPYVTAGRFSFYHPTNRTLPVE